MVKGIERAMKNLLEKAKTVERAFPWSFLGAILGLLGIIAALVIYYVGEVNRKTDLRIHLRSEEELVELREQMPGLQITYEGKSILEAQLRIKIVTLAFVNRGRDIVQTMYDQDLPFGLRFPGSSVVGAELVRPSAAHFLENLKIELATIGENASAPSRKSGKKTNAVLLPKPIFDSGSYMSMKVFLLQSADDTQTKVEVLGKIAGQKEVPVIADEVVTEGGRSAYVAAIVALLGLLVTAVSYCFTLRARSRSIDKAFMIEHLQEDIEHLKRRVKAD